MNKDKDKIESIIQTVREFMNFLDSQGLELDENGDVVPKKENSKLTLELKNEK